MDSYLNMNELEIFDRHQILEDDNILNKFSCRTKPVQRSKWIFCNDTNMKAMFLNSWKLHLVTTWSLFSHPLKLKSFFLRIDEYPVDQYFHNQ